MTRREERRRSVRMRERETDAIYGEKRDRIEVERQRQRVVLCSEESEANRSVGGACGCGGDGAGWSKRCPSAARGKQ